MRSHPVLAALAALLPLLPLSARDAAAQARRAPAPAGRQVSATFGLSGGSAALTCPFCTGEMKGSFAGTMGVETTVRPAVRLGLELQWWRYSGGGATRSVIGGAPVVHFHPFRSRRLFLKTGLGLARFAATSSEEELHTGVIAAVVGAGYDIRLTPQYVLVPYLSWLTGGSGTMRLNGEAVTPRSGVSLVQYGVAIALR
ncbi:MAG TPA: hypothetical protein VLE53_02735 [Gemmatimonadaceae bacterium]|nr:hypothetical protein [Gemmatimonadaceae bacterium]